MGISAKEAAKKLERLRNKQNTDIENREKGGNPRAKKALTLGEYKADFFDIKKNGTVISEKDKVYMASIDIVPYIVGTDHHPQDIPKGDCDYLLEYWQHGKVGVNDSTVICLKRTFGKPCPICEDIERLKTEGASDDDVAPLLPSWKALYNVVDPDGKIMLYSASRQLFHKKMLEELSIYKASGGEELYPADINNGRTVKFRVKAGSFKGHAYWKEFTNFEFKKRDKFDVEILDDAIPLDALLVIPTYDEVKNMYFELDTEEDDTPKKERKRPETDDDTPPFDDKKEEEEKPKTRRTRKVEEEPKNTRDDEPDGEDGNEASESNSIKALLDEMDRAELKKYIKDKELPITPNRKMEDDDLRSAILEELTKLTGEDDTPDEPDPEPPKRERKSSKEDKKPEKVDKKSDKNKCPEGYRFGADFDFEKECEDCKLRDACEEKYNKEFK